MEIGAVRPPVSFNATSVQLKSDGYSALEIRNLKRSGKVECQTCANRTYQDGSDDSGVSYQSPTKISPEKAASAVMSHEQEHVSRNAAKAGREGNQAVSTVKIFRSTCPECGRSYVSGGETRTVTRSQAKKDAENQSFLNKQFPVTEGKNVDKVA